MSNDELKHYGILRKSGRYPWGSGADEYSRSMSFYAMIDSLKAKHPGIPDKDIAKAMGLSVQDLRSTRTIAKEQIVLEQTNRAVALRDKGVSIPEIAKQLDMEPPTVRLRLKNSENMKQSSLRATAEVLRKAVDENDIVDIGLGVEHSMGIASTKLKAAVAVLRDEGYETHNIKTRQVAGKYQTTRAVLVKPGVTFGEASKMRDKIHTIGEWSEDKGMTYLGLMPPKSVSLDRVKVVFDEDGGSKEDGFIYVRRGVPDLDMGKSTYAQVRIMVNGSHYIKGMAVARDDLPPGPDIVFNTNKSRSVGKLGALKKLENDPNMPFGSVIKRQIYETDPKTGERKVKSAINFIREEGDWNEWRNSLPSQMLAKQPHSFIKSQLAETRKQTQKKLAEINTITNPVVRKKALEDFAEKIDSDAVDLRAAAMPRQLTQVILPFPKMNKDEIYAPQFETGERVALIRYPHAGQFEIPEVTVNNNNRTAKKLIGNATDAIGIHPSVAARLSGADFDGDTVVVIPNPKGTVKGVQSMGAKARIYEERLNGFEPQRQYGGFVQTGVDKNGDPVGNFPLMKNTGLEMGKITNLITDMSIQAAQPEDIVKAVRHSMVVIDAEKHKLDYRRSERENSIPLLKERYQGSAKAGATTLLSQATAASKARPETALRKRQDGGPIDPETGAKVLVPTGRTRSVYDPKTQTYTDQKVLITEQPKRLAITDDAYTLVRDKNDPVERAYADHVNEMKAFANQARLEGSKVTLPKINTRAREVYQEEYRGLAAKLKAVETQKPLDRRASDIAAITVKARRQEDPLLRNDRDRLYKVEKQAIDDARARLGLSKQVIEISDREWDAIQSGAISSSMLAKILKNVDSKRIAELSMPRANTVVTSALAARAKAMLDAGLTNADIAKSLGISGSTLRAAISRGDV